MDRLDALSCFIAVVDAGGFSAAARQSGLSQPSISKAVSALEKRLGVVLLNRSTRRVGLTEQGRLYHERAKALLEEMREIESDIIHGVQGASGLLRISAPATFGRLHVMPVVQKLLSIFPGLEVDIVLADAMRDMIEDGTDLAVRVGTVSEPDVVVRRVARSKLVCVGSHAYFKVHGRPRIPSDLSTHNCLIYGRQRGADEWPFVGPTKAHRVKVSGSLRSNSIEVIRAGVLGGLGIGMMTAASLAGELDVPDIQTVLDDYIDRPIDISIVWPTRRFVPGRVRIATDFLAAAIAQRLA
jgi:DNA-binding transcriptional LysR family regulator